MCLDLWWGKGPLYLHVLENSLAGDVVFTVDVSNGNQTTKDKTDFIHEGKGVGGGGGGVWMKFTIFFLTPPTLPKVSF